MFTYLSFLFMQTVGGAAANAKRLSPAAATTAASSSAAFPGVPSAQNGRPLSGVEATVAADGHSGGGGLCDFGVIRALVHGGSAAEGDQPQSA